MLTGIEKKFLAPLNNGETVEFLADPEKVAKAKEEALEDDSSNYMQLHVASQVRSGDINELKELAGQIIWNEVKEVENLPAGVCPRCKLFDYGFLISGRCPSCD